MIKAQDHIILPKSNLSWEGEPSGSVGSKRTGSALPILIENEIRLNWIDYSTLYNGRFKYLIVEV